MINTVIIECINHPDFVSLSTYKDFEGGSKGWIVTYAKELRGNWCAWGKTQEEACKNALLVMTGKDKQEN